jgi:hypothetical protein
MKLLNRESQGLCPEPPDSRLDGGASSRENQFIRSVYTTYFDYLKKSTNIYSRPRQKVQRPLIPARGTVFAIIDTARGAHRSTIRFRPPELPCAAISELSEHKEIDQAREKIRSAEKKKRNGKKEYINLLLQNALRMQNLLAEEIEMIVGRVLGAAVHVSQYGDLDHYHDDHDKARHNPQEKLQVDVSDKIGTENHQYGQRSRQHDVADRGVDEAPQGLPLPPEHVLNQEVYVRGEGYLQQY